MRFKSQGENERIEPTKKTPGGWAFSIQIKRWRRIVTSRWSSAVVVHGHQTTREPDSGCERNEPEGKKATLRKKSGGEGSVVSEAEPIRRTHTWLRSTKKLQWISRVLRRKESILSEEGGRASVPYGRRASVGRSTKNSEILRRGAEKVVSGRR